jgi:hypothetical protein
MSHRQTTRRTTQQRFDRQIALQIAQFRARLCQQNQTDAALQLDFILVIERFGDGEQPAVAVQQVSKISISFRLASRDRLLKLWARLGVLAALEQQLRQEEPSVGVVRLGRDILIELLNCLLVVTARQRRRGDAEMVRLEIARSHRRCQFGRRFDAWRSFPGRIRHGMATKASQANQPASAQQHCLSLMSTESWIAAAVIARGLCGID